MILWFGRRVGFAAADERHRPVEMRRNGRHGAGVLGAVPQPSCGGDDWLLVDGPRRRIDGSAVGNDRCALQGAVVPLQGCKHRPRRRDDAGSVSQPGGDGFLVRGECRRVELASVGRAP